MKTQQIQNETIIARSVAAEDLCAGDFVAILNEIYEYPSYLWQSDSFALPPHEPVRVQWQAVEKGLPLKIVDVCLPFVLVKRPCGQHQTLDVRRCQFVRLQRRYAKRVCKLVAVAGSGGSRSCCQ